MPKVAIILINYKDYAKKYLPGCIASLRQQSYPKDSFKIFIVDNATSAETVEYLKKTAPEAEIIAEDRNTGFALGNNLAMHRAIEAGYDYVVLFNMDTIADERWLEELVKEAEKIKEAEKKVVNSFSLDFCDRENLTKREMDQCNKGNKLVKSIGAVQSLILLHPQTDKINSLGNQLHFLGFGFCQGYGKKITNDKLQMTNNFFYASGAAVLYPVKALREVGLFDPEFFMYHEDTDLSWRLRQAGYEIVLAPKSVMWHKYQFSRSILQFYYMERNRMIMMFENYRLGTLFLILPAFFAMEIGQLGYALLRGLFWTKLKVYGYFLKPKNWVRMVKNKRRKARLRKVGDRQLAKLIVGKLEFQEIANPVLKYLVNPVFNLYWKIIRQLIFW